MIKKKKTTLKGKGWNNIVSKTRDAKKDEDEWKKEQKNNDKDDKNNGMH